MNTPKTSLDSAVAKLKRAGLRHTPIRFRILEVIASAGRPVTIGEIHRRVGPPSCDLVTVYRNLDIMEHAGIVRRFFRAKGTAIFDIGADTPSIPIVSRHTEGVSHTDSTSADEIVAALEKAKERLTAQGYAGVSLLVQFFADSGPKDQGEQPRRRYGNWKAAL